MLPVDYVSSVEDEFRNIRNGRCKKNSIRPSSGHTAQKVSKACTNVYNIVIIIR